MFTEKETLVARIHDDGVAQLAGFLQDIEQTLDVVIDALHTSEVSLKIFLVAGLGIRPIIEMTGDAQPPGQAPRGVGSANAGPETARSGRAIGRVEEVGGLRGNMS
jgi:hypothetical protein